MIKKLKLFKMTILIFNDFMKKKSKNDTMNECELQKVLKYKIYPRDTKMFSDKVLLILIMVVSVVVIGLVL